MVKMVDSRDNNTTVFHYSNDGARADDGDCKCDRGWFHVGDSHIGMCRTYEIVGGEFTKLFDGPTGYHLTDHNCYDFCRRILEFHGLDTELVAYHVDH